MDLDPVSVQYNINVVVGFKRSTIVHWQLVVINSTAHPQDLFTAIFVLFYGSWLSQTQRNIHLCVLTHYGSLWGQRNRRYDLILLYTVFLFSCPSTIKTRRKAHTCVPVGKAWHANMWHGFYVQCNRDVHLEKGQVIKQCCCLSLHEMEQEHITQWVWLNLLWLLDYLPVF